MKKGGFDLRGASLDLRLGIQLEIMQGGFELPMLGAVLVFKRRSPPESNERGFPMARGGFQM